MLEHQRKSTNEDMIFLTMMQALLSPRMPQNVYLTVLKRGIDSKITDAFMQDCLGLVAQNQLQRQALDIFDPVAPSFPLSIARIHVMVNEPKSALATLEAYPPVLDLDKLIGQGLALTARLMDEETTQEESVETFTSFAREAIPLMRQLANSSLVQWQRIAVFFEIRRSLKFALIYGEDRVEELRFLADSVVDQQTDDEFKRAIAVIEAQFE